MRTWASQLIKMRHHLESRLGCKISKDSALFTWLVSWTSDAISRFKVQENGRTHYGMSTGHRCNAQMVGFAEKVMFKFTTDKTKRNKMNTEWSQGYFVGMVGRTSEYLIATDEGIFTCTTLG